MSDSNRLDSEVLAHSELLARLNVVEIAFETEIPKLVLNEAQRESQSVHRHVQFSEKIRYGSDMVLVTVSNNEPLDLLFCI